MIVYIPNILVSWTLMMPDDALSMVSGDTPEEKEAKVEGYLKPLFREHFNGLPIGERQTINLADGLPLPFDCKLVGNQLEVRYCDECDHDLKTRLDMGTQAIMAYELKIKGWFRNPTMHLVVEFPEQDLSPKPLTEVAARLARERNWHEFVLRQSHQWAKGYGSVHDDDCGILMVKVGRNGGEPCEPYKNYEIADFIEHIEADLTTDAAALADVTCLAVQPRVFFYTDPTDWEHDCMGIPWDELQRRTREGETIILYPIH